MNKETIKLELEKLKIEYDHCEKIVWNVLWIVTLVTALLITAIIKDVIDFFHGLFLFCIFSLIIAIGMIPIAKKSDDIINKHIPNLIEKLK